jgi:uncharacterized protein (DUF58 family)
MAVPSSLLPGLLATWRDQVRQRLFRHAAADAAAVTLRHSRIYILPTRRGLALIATLATMLVTSLNYGLALGFVVVFMLTGLVGAALLHAFRNLVGLTLRPLAAGEAFVGGRVPFSLALAGEGRSRCAIALAAGTPGAKVVQDVPTLGAPACTIEVPAPVRGRVPLGRVTVSSDYPLGLWRGWAYVHFQLAGVAFPLPEPSAPPVPAGTSGPDARASGRSEDADLAGLRAYQPGDPMQRVAWKAVARGTGWYTKQFEGAGGGGPVTLAWSQLPGSLGTEDRLARLAAWILACERTARPYVLDLPGTRLAIGHGHDHCRHALTALAVFDPPAQATA